jgi:pimeloyl-ACP methyl ester carboxylesterase
MGPARGPVAVCLGPGPWEGFAEGIGRLAYRTFRPGRDIGRDLDEAGLSEDLTLVGHGAGAIEAARLAAARPEILKRLILIAPEGMTERPEPPLAARLRRLPLLGERLAARVPRRDAPLLGAEHRAIGEAGVPVIALWAGRDEVVPLRGLGQLALWNRAAKQEVVEGAGHDLLATHAQQVVAALRDVLREDWAA